MTVTNEESVIYIRDEYLKALLRDNDEIMSLLIPSIKWYLGNKKNDKDPFGHMRERVFAVTLNKYGTEVDKQPHTNLGSRINIKFLNDGGRLPENTSNDAVDVPLFYQMDGTHILSGNFKNKKGKPFTTKTVHRSVLRPSSGQDMSVYRYLIKLGHNLRTSDKMHRWIKDNYPMSLMSLPDDFLRNSKNSAIMEFKYVSRDDGITLEKMTAEEMAAIEIETITYDMSMKKRSISDIRSYYDELNTQYTRGQLPVELSLLIAINTYFEDENGKPKYFKNVNEIGRNCIRMLGKYLSMLCKDAGYYNKEEQTYSTYIPLGTVDDTTHVRYFGLDSNIKLKCSMLYSTLIQLASCNEMIIHFTNTDKEIIEQLLMMSIVSRHTASFTKKIASLLMLNICAQGYSINNHIHPTYMGFSEDLFSTDRTYHPNVPCRDCNPKIIDASKQMRTETYEQAFTKIVDSKDWSPKPLRWYLKHDPTQAFTKITKAELNEFVLHQVRTLMCVFTNMTFAISPDAQETVTALQKVDDLSAKREIFLSNNPEYRKLVTDTVHSVWDHVTKTALREQFQAHIKAAANPAASLTANSSGEGGIEILYFDDVDDALKAQNIYNKKGNLSEADKKELSLLKKKSLRSKSTSKRASYAFGFQSSPNLEEYLMTFDKELLIHTDGDTKEIRDLLMNNPTAVNKGVDVGKRLAYRESRQIYMLSTQTHLILVIVYIPITNHVNKPQRNLGSITIKPQYQPIDGDSHFIGRYFGVDHVVNDTSTMAALAQVPLTGRYLTFGNDMSAFDKHVHPEYFPRIAPELLKKHAEELQNSDKSYLFHLDIIQDTKGNKYNYTQLCDIAKEMELINIIVKSPIDEVVLPFNKMPSGSYMTGVGNTIVNWCITQVWRSHFESILGKGVIIVHAQILGDDIALVMKLSDGTDWSEEDFKALKESLVNLPVITGFESNVEKATTIMIEYTKFVLGFGQVSHVNPIAALAEGPTKSKLVNARQLSAAVTVWMAMSRNLISHETYIFLSIFCAAVQEHKSLFNEIIHNRITVKSSLCWLLPTDMYGCGLGLVSSNFNTLSVLTNLEMNDLAAYLLGTNYLFKQIEDTTLQSKLSNQFLDVMLGKKSASESNIAMNGYGKLANAKFENIRKHGGDFSNRMELSRESEDALKDKLISEARIHKKHNARNKLVAKVSSTLNDMSVQAHHRRMSSLIAEGFTYGDNTSFPVHDIEDVSATQILEKGKFELRKLRDDSPLLYGSSFVAFREVELQTKLITPTFPLKYIPFRHVLQKLGQKTNQPKEHTYLDELSNLFSKWESEYGIYLVPTSFIDLIGNLAALVQPTIEHYKLILKTIYGKESAADHASELFSLMQRAVNFTDYSFSATLLEYLSISDAKQLVKVRSSARMSTGDISAHFLPQIFDIMLRVDKVLSVDVRPTTKRISFTQMAKNSAYRVTFTNNMDERNS